MSGSSNATTALAREFQRQKNIGWRLDYILVSEGMAQKATDCRVLADVGTSDHGPVMATFDVRT